MNNAQKYWEENMKDLTFRKAYLEEKTKLDLEFMLDELENKIKMETKYNDLLKGVRKIKRVLVNA
ncbi:MAG: hypothetical protein V1779_08555 [bacterium]